MLITGCPYNEYRCKNQCIELVKRCDKFNDCDEGEDEDNCSESMIVLIIFLIVYCYRYSRYRESEIRY